MLLQGPPKTIAVGGKDCPIKTDFRHWIKFAQTLNNGRLTCYERSNIALMNVYGMIPESFEEAIKKAEWFYSCGKEQRGESTQEKLLDWDVDGATIWADFVIWCRIDLQAVSYLHWWNFMALFSCLPSESGIKRRIDLRSIDLSTIKDPVARENYRQQKELVALETIDEDIDTFYSKIH